MMYALPRRVLAFLTAATILMWGWSQSSVARADDRPVVKVLALGDSYTSGLGGRCLLR